MSHFVLLKAVHVDSAVYFKSFPYDKNFGYII